MNMDRVLSTPELLSLILSSIECIPTYARCARVCKVWHEIALPFLWNNVNEIEMLLLLLPIASYVRDGKVKRVEYINTKKAISKNDWKRFNKYARHVKVLNLTYASYNLNTAFNDIAWARKDVHLLPNLTTLRVSSVSTVPYWLLFLHDKLERLEITKLTGDEETDQRFLKAIVERAPNIVHLKVRARHDSILSLHYNWDSFLSELKPLRTIELPAFTLTTSVIDVLSTLPNLESISMLEVEQNLNQEDLSEEYFELLPELEEDAFPSLRKFACTTMIDELSTFIDSNECLDEITELDYKSIDYVSRASFLQCMDNIVQNWSSLISIKMDLNFIKLLEGDPEPVQLDFDSIEPLMGLPNIEEFILHSPKHIRLTLPDINTIVDSWPNARRIHLSPEPLWLDTPELTLEALTPFALFCPKMEELALYVNTEVTDDLPDLTIPMPNLTHLSFGASDIQRQDTATIYLARFCFPKCHIGYSYNENIVYPNIEFKHARSKRAKSWKTVSENFKLVSKAVWKERLRTPDNPGYFEIMESDIRQNVDI